MKPFLLYVVETLFCSGLFLAVYRLLLVRRLSFAACRRYLLAACLTALLLPALRIPVYPVRGEDEKVRAALAGFPVSEESAAVIGNGVAAEGLPVAGVARADFGVWLKGGGAVLYVVAALLLFVLFVRRWSAVRRLRRSCRLTCCPGYTLAEGARVRSPFSFLRTMFLPPDFQGVEREQIVCHEASHIRHRHSAERIVMELLGCLCWFNPFLWMAFADLREVQEWEADRDVLDRGFDLTRYRMLIFRQLFGYRPDITCGLNHSFTKKRFLMMTKRRRGRFALVRLSALIPVVAAMLFLCSFTTRSAGQTPDSPTPDELPDLSGLDPISVHVTFIGIRPGGGDGSHEAFEFMEYLPVDSTKYLVAKGDGRTSFKVTDLKGKDITQWAEKHYFVKATNPVFFIDGIRYSKDEYVLHSQQQKAAGDTRSPVSSVYYAGPAAAEAVGDSTVDLVVVERSGLLPDGNGPDSGLDKPSAPAVAIRISTGRIYVNDQPVAVDALSGAIEAQREKGAEMAILTANPDTPMSLVLEVKQALRKAKLLRLQYEGAGLPSLSRPLPPMDSDESVSLLQVVPDDTAVKVSPHGETTVKARNLIQVYVNGGGEIMAGPVGRMEKTDLSELKQSVMGFILNADDRADGVEKKLRSIDLPKGGTWSYPVSSAIVSVQVSQRLDYKTYLEVLCALKDAYGEIRAKAAESAFGRGYNALDEMERQVVNRAVPMHISEAEPRG